MSHFSSESDEISRKIKSLRESIGWTQAKLAERAGITGAALSKIESGSGRIPTYVVLRKLATAMSVPVYELTGDIPPAKNSAPAVTSFYRKWRNLEELSEKDQKLVQEMAERLAELRKK